MSKFLALDVCGRSVRLLAGSAKKGRVQIDKALAYEEADAVSPLTAKAAGKRLRERMKDAGVGPAPVLGLIGRDRLLLHTLTIPAGVKPAEEPALVRFQTVKELTGPADEAVIDYAPPRGDGDRQALAVVAKKADLRLYADLTEAAGLKLAGTTARAFAAMAGLQQAAASGAIADPEADPLALLTAGAGWAEFVVADGGEVVFARSVSAASLDSEQALVNEMKRNLAVFASQNPGRPIGALYVAEADAPGGRANRLAAGLPSPVYAFDPSEGFADRAPEAGSHLALSGLVGLAEKGKQLPVNFAAPREPKPESDPNRKTILLALAAMLLLTAAGAVFGFIVKGDLSDELVRKRGEGIRLDNELRGYGLDVKKHDAIDDWAGREVVWLDELYDLTHRFPELDSARLVQFEGAEKRRETRRRRPGEPAKKGPKYVADVKLVIQASSGKYADMLISAIRKDEHFNVEPKRQRGLTGEKRDKMRQVYEVTAEVAAHTPEDYKLRLKDLPPEEKKPPRRRGGGGPRVMVVGGGR